MAKFGGMKCDGPNCANVVDEKDSKARKWLRLNFQTDGFNSDYTYCSYECVADHIQEIIRSREER